MLRTATVEFKSRELVIATITFPLEHDKRLTEDNLPLAFRAFNPNMLTTVADIINVANTTRLRESIFFADVQICANVEAPAPR
jgi:hypothetical protein